MVTNLLNFAMVVVSSVRSSAARRFADGADGVYVTVLPAEFATGLLTAGVAFSATDDRRRRRRAARSRPVRLPVPAARRRRGLRARRGALGSAPGSSRRSRSGLLSTVMQTLSMRDTMTARHSAAVARYSREVARMIGPRRARAGPDPHRRAAARHRQVHLPRLDPLRGPQAHRRGVGDGQAAPGAGSEARPPDRGLRPRGRHHLLPSRALRRQRVLQGAARADPARLPDHRGGRHVRRHDVTRLRTAGRSSSEAATRRAAPRGRRPTRPDWWSRRSSRWSSAAGIAFRHADDLPTSSWSSRSTGASRITRVRVGRRCGQVVRIGG